MHAFAPIAQTGVPSGKVHSPRHTSVHSCTRPHNLKFYFMIFRPSRARSPLEHWRGLGTPCDLLNVAIFDASGGGSEGRAASGRVDASFGGESYRRWGFPITTVEGMLASRVHCGARRVPFPSGVPI